MNISIILPAYNEEKNIGYVINECEQYLKNETRISQYEIIIINDGSIDNTLGVVNDYLNTHVAPDAVMVISHEENKGYGAALRSGFNAAKYEWVFYMDSDQQFIFSEISTFIDYIDTHHISSSSQKILTGVRMRRQDNTWRSINAWIYKLSLRLIFGITASDINCAFKLIPRNVLQGIHLTAQGATINAELFYYAHNKHVEVIEIPVTHKSRIYGMQTGANISVILKAIWALVVLRCTYVK